MKLNKTKAGRPLTDDVAATGHIHLRVTLARKGWYVRTARLYNQTLAEWMQQECDKSSGYPTFKTDGVQ